MVGLCLSVSPPISPINCVFSNLAYRSTLELTSTGFRDDKGTTTLDRVWAKDGNRRKRRSGHQKAHRHDHSEEKRPGRGEKWGPLRCLIVRRDVERTKPAELLSIDGYVGGNLSFTPFLLFLSSKGMLEDEIIKNGGESFFFLLTSTLRAIPTFFWISETALFWTVPNSY